MSRKAVLEQACPEDGPALLRMMEAAPSEGNIRLLYTRRPDPYRSYHGEGGQVSLGVIRGPDGTPDFMESCVLRPYYLNGEVQTVGYLSGVRRRQEARLRANWLRALIEYEGPKCPSYLMSILDGNEDALRVFGKKRPYATGLVPVCDYTTYMVSPRALAGGGMKPGPGTVLETLTPETLPDAYAFLAEYSKEYNFFPAVTALEEQFTGLRLADCLCVRQVGKIIAFGALWDQTAYKQYVVQQYASLMRLARMASPLLRALGYVPVPRAGTVLRLATLTLLSAGDGASFETLLAGLGGLAGERGYGTIVVGTPGGNWQGEYFERVRHLKFGSKIYVTQMLPAPELLPDGRLPVHMECGFL